MADTDREGPKVKFGADTEGLESGVTRAADIVRDGVEKMKTDLGALGAVVGMVSGVFEELTRELLGGFKHAITSVVTELANLARETKVTMQTFGMTSVEASALNVALGDIGSSSEAGQAAFMRFSRQIKSNSEGLKEYGIDIAKMRAEGKTTFEMFQEAIQVTAEYKAGMDQTQVAMHLFGRNIGEIAKLQKLNNEVIEEARQKQEDLGLTMTKYNLETAKEFKRATNDVEDVLSALSKAAGTALMPVLTKMSQWFADIGPGAVMAFRLAINVLGSALEGFVMAASLVWNTIAGAIEQASIILITFGDILRRIMTGFSPGELAAAWDRGMEMIQASAEKRLKNVLTTAEDVRKNLNGMWGDDSGAAKPSGGDKTAPIGKTPGGDNSQFQVWRQELEQMRDQADTFRGLELKAETDFWAEKLLLTEKGSEDERRALHELVQAGKKEDKEQLAEALRNFDEKKLAAGKHKDEIVQIETAKAALLLTIYGEDSKEYKKALQEKIKAERDYAEEVRKIQLQKIKAQNDLFNVELAGKREQLDYEEKIGLLSNEEKLRASAQLDKQQYAAKRQMLEDEAQLEQEDVLRHQQILDEMAKLDKEYQNTVSKNQHALALESMKNYEGMLNAVTSAIDTSVKGIIQGTTTLKKALSNIFLSIGLEFVNMLMGMFKNWVKTKIAEALFGKQVATEEVTTEAVKSAAIIAAAKTTSAAMISSYAATAGAAGVQSAAAIPYYGWALAPEAGMMDYAAAMSFQGMSMLSAAGGSWRVPEDQMAMVHKDESILPAEHSEGLRNMIENGGSAGGGASIYINAVDADSVRKLLRREGGTLVDSLKRQSRNFRR